MFFCFPFARVKKKRILFLFLASRATSAARSLSCKPLLVFFFFV